MKKSYSVIEHEIDPARRRLLRHGFHGLGILACGGLLTACHWERHNRNPQLMQADPGPLLAPDENGLKLPRGYTSRIVARSGSPVLSNSDFIWHAAPDGGAVFRLKDNGWIYVSNCEMRVTGGVGALRFNASGEIVDAYSVLEGTDRNCAGGPTPWQTWLSCEEVPRGQVWECDPTGRQTARALPALGMFNHEAVAVDPQTLQLYLTEDRADGCLYRYTPVSIGKGIPDLHSGKLEVAEVVGEQEGFVRWHHVPDPGATLEETRYQVSRSTKFRGGEGAWYANRTIYFTTKLDSRVWAYTPDTDELVIIYDHSYFPHPLLRGADNVTVSETGAVYVAEDGGDMRLVMISANRRVLPVLQITGHPLSEVTGPAFDPSGKRLYFSSQRGATGNPYDGVTYEVSGPFS